MKFQVFQETRQGARKTNQDRIGYMYTSECAILIACDGMGGHHRGEFAAEYVVQFLANAFRRVAQPKIKDPCGFLKASILAAHEALLNSAAAEKFIEVPRTTCVAAIIQDANLYWAHVGDSRIYLIRADGIQAKSKDHSHVQNLVDVGVISEEEALTHPEKNKIFNCIGQPLAPRVDVQNAIALKKDDDILLSTDGLWGPVPLATVAEVITSNGPVIGTQMLLDVAESLSGKACDNLSAVALRWIDPIAVGVQDNEVDVKAKLITDQDVKIAQDLIKTCVHAPYSEA